MANSDLALGGPLGDPLGGLDFTFRSWKKRSSEGDLWDGTSKKVFRTLMQGGSSRSQSLAACRTSGAAAAAGAVGAARGAATVARGGRCSAGACGAAAQPTQPGATSCATALPPPKLLSFDGRVRWRCVLRCRLREALRSSKFVGQPGTVLTNELSMNGEAWYPFCLRTVPELALGDVLRIGEAQLPSKTGATPTTVSQVPGGHAMVPIYEATG